MDFGIRAAAAGGRSSGPEARAQSLIEVLEQQLSKHREARGDAGASEAEFVELAMHDLQNAVSLLETSMDSLYVGMTNLRPRELSAVRDARLASRRIQRYIDHLVTSERVTNGMLRVRKSRFPLGPVLRDLVEEYEHYAADWGGRVTVDMDTSAQIVVLADEVLLTRVIQNLVENALRHNRANGRVLVETRVSDGVQVRFCNEGARIAPEQRERVFEKFFASPQMGASGIGLYFARVAVAAHGGTLIIEDDPEWPVCFVLRLPAESLSAA
jgi:signal transduction histidine kinase